MTALGLLYAWWRSRESTGAPAPDADGSPRRKWQLSSLDTYPVYQLDKKLSPDEKFEILAEQVRQHRDLIRELKVEDFGLKKLIEKASADASSLSLRTVAGVR